MTGDLLEAIREKQKRLQDLRREIVAVEAELREAKAILGERPREIGRVGFRKRPIRPRSSVWWAKSALVHAGKPMHIDELVKRVEEFSSQAVRKSTLVSNLSRYVRSRDTFSRPEEGIYGLLDFEGGVETEKGAEGPPLEAGVAKR